MRTQKHARRYFWIAVLVGLFLLSFWIIKEALSCSAYECVSFPDKKLWKIQTTYEKNNSLWRGLLIHPDYLVRLEQVSGVLAKKSNELTTIRLMQTQGLFDTAQSPYPGVITDRIVCDERYKPKPQTLVSASGVVVTYYSALLNSRLQYGSCADDQIVYKGYAALFYCSQTNNWYQLELIIPKSKATEESVYIDMFKQIGCQRPSLNIGKLLP